MRALWLIGLLLLGGPSGPPRSLSLHLSAQVLFEPAFLRLRVTVGPVDDQRLLRVEMDNGVFYRASEIPLDGAAGPVTSYVEWRDIPGGDYQVTARVATASAVVAQAQATCLVVRRF